MTNINVEIPEEVHKKLKVACAMKGISLKQAIIELLEKKVKDEVRR